MKFANNVFLRVFCKGVEDKEIIKEGLFKVSGFSVDDLSKDKIFVNETVTKGFDDAIIIFELSLTKDRHINFFLSNLKNNLSSKDIDFLITQDDRLDSEFNFFIRLSKQSVFCDAWELTESGDCFHIKINVASFPKNKVNALSVIKQVFS